jgi:hypothetical protein
LAEVDEQESPIAMGMMAVTFDDCSPDLILGEMRHRSPDRQRTAMKASSFFAALSADGMISLAH